MAAESKAENSETVFSPFSIEERSTVTTQNSVPDLGNTLIHKRYLFFCIPEDWVAKSGDQAINNGSAITVILLLNNMIGSGILSQPYVFKTAGIASTILEYIIVGYMQYTGVVMLATVAEKLKLYDYTDICQSVYGRYGAICVDWSILFYIYGALISYFLVIGSLYGDIVTNYSDCVSWGCSPSFITTLVAIFLVLPMCLIRNFGHLGGIAVVSIAVIVLVVCLVVFGGPTYGSAYAHENINSGADIGTITTIGNVVFAFAFTNSSAHAHHAMKDKSLPTFRKVAASTTISGVLLCFVTGLSGYLSFRSSTKSNILANFPGVVASVFKVAVMIHLILFIPGDFVVTRSSIYRLCGKNVIYETNAMYITTTLFILFSVVLIAVVVLAVDSNDNSLAILLDVTGGVGGSMICFIMPGLLAYKTLSDDISMQYKSIAMVTVGGVILIITIVTSFMA